MDENWITPEELRGIADYCESLQPLWDALVKGPRGGVSVDLTDGIELNVYDANGNKLGRISWGADGPAFYPDIEVIG